MSNSKLDSFDKFMMVIIGMLALSFLIFTISISYSVLSERCM